MERSFARRQRSPRTSSFAEQNHHQLIYSLQVPSMPNQIPNFQISHFLSTQTIPLLLTSLPRSSPEDRTCPICHDPYASPPRDYVHPDIGAGHAEYAVQVRNRGTCRHIFGRRCIETHIRGGNPWSHTCPICRVEWFPSPNLGRSVVLRDVESAMIMLAGVYVDDEQVRRELEEVDRALERIREVLYGYRWI